MCRSVPQGGPYPAQGAGKRPSHRAVSSALTPPPHIASSVGWPFRPPQCPRRRAPIRACSRPSGSSPCRGRGPSGQNRRAAPHRIRRCVRPKWRSAPRRGRLLSPRPRARPRTRHHHHHKPRLILYCFGTVLWPPHVLRTCPSCAHPVRRTCCAQNHLVHRTCHARLSRLPRTWRAHLRTARARGLAIQRRSPHLVRRTCCARRASFRGCARGDPSGGRRIAPNHECGRPRLQIPPP